MSGDINDVISTDFAQLEIDPAGGKSLIDEFPNKEIVSSYSDLRVLQPVLARQAIIERSGYLGEQMKKGRFLEGGHNESDWVIYKLNDNTGRIAVLWNHYDDDSWSVFFKGDNLELEHLIYEN
jgi:hypothetical protein